MRVPDSRITRYWFDCVKIVDTMRCPNASYSALSTVPTLTPNRAALSRSISTYAARPLSSWLLATSASSGNAPSADTTRGAHVDSNAPSADCNVN